MKLMRILDDESVEQTDELYLDGYSFGDRMLEGLPVKFTLNQEGKLTASADWPKGMDSAYWEERAVQFAMEQDCFSTGSDLSSDDGFILFETGQD